ncbi:MAG: lytic transglycosylase domain-containing protein [Gammaproteobacteria bacterium]|nr:lytic transglycosylase domain-containing protein [Gammaproteobacteria bacterium]
MNVVAIIRCAAICLVLGAAPVQADIFKFVDENNVVHFTNIPNDSRYRLYKRTSPQQVAISYDGRNSASGADRMVALRANRQRYTPMINTTAAQYQVDPALVHAVIMAESGYNPNAVSPKGATGLMQLMPGTAQRYGVYDSYDAAANIRGGTRYLRDLLEMFNQNIQLAVAAYNAGENAVINHGNQIPPYRETRNYVSRVLAFYSK